MSVAVRDAAVMTWLTLCRPWRGRWVTSQEAIVTQKFVWFVWASQSLTVYFVPLEISPYIWHTCVKMKLVAFHQNDGLFCFSLRQYGNFLWTIMMLITELCAVFHGRCVRPLVGCDVLKHSWPHMEWWFATPHWVSLSWASWRYLWCGPEIS